jgi:hypothetical protein
MFWLEDQADKTKIIEVKALNTSIVKTDGLQVNVTFAANLLTQGATYSFRWPDNVLFDDYINAVWGSKHIENSDCKMTTFVALRAGDADAPTDAPSTPATDKVKVTYTVSNLDFNVVENNAELKSSITDAVKDAVLSGLTGYTRDDIDVVLSAGSIKAEVSITPKAGSTADELQTTVSASQDTMKTSVTTMITQVSGVEQALDTGMSLSDVSTTSVVVIDGSPPSTPSPPSPPSPPSVPTADDGSMLNIGILAMVASVAASL